QPHPPWIRVSGLRCIDVPTGPPIFSEPARDEIDQPRHGFPSCPGSGRNNHRALPDPPPRDHWANVADDGCNGDVTMVNAAAMTYPQLTNSCEGGTLTLSNQ